MDIYELKEVLLNAVKMGNEEEVKSCLRHDISLDTDYLDDETPLIWAAMKNHVSIAKLLVEKGASACLRDDDYRMPLHYAAINGNVDMAKILFKAKPLFISALDLHGVTPLMIAARHGHINFLKCLLEVGEDINFTTSDGITAISEAAVIGDKETIAFLVKNGADIEAIIKPKKMMDLHADCLTEMYQYAKTYNRRVWYPFFKASDKKREIYQKDREMILQGLRSLYRERSHAMDSIKKLVRHKNNLHLEKKDFGLKEIKDLLKKMDEGL